MTTFAWVLEDVRCRKWSPTPVYLEAGFWSKNNFNSPYSDADPNKAKRFETWADAERFMADHGLNEHFEAVEHGWMDALTAP